MKSYVINAFIKKDKNVDRRNFIIKSDSNSEESIKSLINNQLNIDKEKFEFLSDKFELISKESVVIYHTSWKKIETGSENEGNNNM
jgi:pimeloyl-CoA synthetase